MNQNKQIKKTGGDSYGYGSSAGYAGEEAAAPAVSADQEE